MGDAVAQAQKRAKGGKEIPGLDAQKEKDQPQLAHKDQKGGQAKILGQRANELVALHGTLLKDVDGLE